LAIFWTNTIWAIFPRVLPLSDGIRDLVLRAQCGARISAAMLTRFFQQPRNATSMDTRSGNYPGWMQRYIAPITAPYKQRVFSGVRFAAWRAMNRALTLKFAMAARDAI